MSEPTPGALSPGQIFHGRYEIVRCLKAGGMGAVYECIHLKTRKHRAIKVMLPQMLADAGMRDRFELEARVTAEIESDHIVETFDAGVDDVTGAPFLVMELLRGEDLTSILKKRGLLPASEAIVLLAQAALALDKTHAAGIVHRDLKPDNLYVTTRDDGSPRLKILDFGIAKVVADVNQTVQRTATIGTPLYMSPEQILGEGTVGPGADIYAMGHIAFTLLTGAAYWADEQKASPALFVFLGNVMAGAVEPATARAQRRGVVLPPAFDAWFARSIAKSAGDRFGSASMLVGELAGVMGAQMPRLGSLPVIVLDGRVPSFSFAGSTPVFTEPVPIAAPAGSPAPTVTEGTTVIASSKSIKSIGSVSKRPTLLVVAMGLGALGLAGVGFLAVSTWSHTASPTKTLAAPVGALVDTTISEAGTPDSTPTAAPSATPAPTSPSGAASTTAPPAQARSISKVVPAKPVPTKPVAPTDACNPPYVMNGSGHRVMKPQCL